MRYPKPYTLNDLKLIVDQHIALNCGEYEVRGFDDKAPLIDTVITISDERFLLIFQ